jgi:hypothetical protein
MVRAGLLDVSQVPRSPDDDECFSALSTVPRLPLVMAGLPGDGNRSCLNG